jgi:hypothetical protein
MADGLEAEVGQGEVVEDSEDLVVAVVVVAEPVEAGRNLFENLSKPPGFL